jgi:hypothetical protein
LLVLMVLVGDLQPAEATLPGKNGEIALSAPAEFVPNSRADEVFTIRPDGTRMKQHTSASSSWNPTFSPNGAKITFARIANSEDTRTAEIFDKDADGMGRNGFSTGILSTGSGAGF